MDGIKIEDESGDKKYFTIIPNYILNHSTLWDREVYIQMKKIAGENGTCWTSRNTLAKQCGMSPRRLDKSIQYLVSHSWIKTIGKKEVSTKGGKQEVNEYKIIDLWDTNNSFYQDKNKGVALKTIPLSKGVARMQRGSTDDTKGIAPGATKEEPLNNNQETVAKATLPFSFEEEIQKLSTGTRTDYKIIALYWKRKGYIFENQKQFNSALKRELRPASLLTGYKGEQVGRAIRYCIDNYTDIGWTLETVGKRIADLVNKK